MQYIGAQSESKTLSKTSFTDDLILRPQGGGGGMLPYMGYIGMCRCEGYGFQAVYSKIGYHFQEIDQLVEDFI